MISKWLPDWELTQGWDIYEQEEEKAVPCLNCFGRGQPRDHPRLKDLKLPRGVLNIRTGQHGQAPECFRQTGRGQLKPVPRVGKGRAQVLRERALRMRSEKSVGGGPSSVCSDDSLSVCSDSVLMKSPPFSWSQLSTPSASIAGDRAEMPADQFQDLPVPEKENQGQENSGRLEFASDSDSSSQESLSMERFGEASHYHSQGARQRGYAFNVNFSNLNKNTARFDSRELGDFIPAKLPLHRSGGFGHSGRVGRPIQREMDVTSMEDFPVLGVPAAPPTVPSQSSCSIPIQGKSSSSMKTIACSIAKEQEINSIDTTVVPEISSSLIEGQSTNRADPVLTDPPTDGTHCLSIAGLPADCSPDILHSLLADYGEIISCKLKREGDSCSAIVCMETEDACEWAMSCLDGCESSAGEGQIQCYKL